MIIEISDAFLGMPVAGLLHYQRALENLLSANAEGWHVVVPSRDLCAEILAKLELSRIQNHVLKHQIQERLSTLLGYALSADFTLLCLPDGLPLQTTRTNQIAIPLIAFDDLRNCSPCILLTENAGADGEFLESLARELSRDLGYGTPLAIDKMHGGGGTIGARYGALVTQARPSICIVDSDRTYPGGPLGTTAQQILGQMGTEHYLSVSAIILPVRELENTVPISVLLEIYSNDPIVRTRISKLISYLEHCRNQNIDCISSYFDMKCGMCAKHVALIPLPQRQKFVNFSNFVRGEAEACEDFDDLNDDTCVCEGVSNHLLQHATAALNGPRRIARLFTIKLQKSPNWEWIEPLARKILAFGAGGERVRVA